MKRQIAVGILAALLTVAATRWTATGTGSGAAAAGFPKGTLGGVLTLPTSGSSATIYSLFGNTNLASTMPADGVVGLNFYVRLSAAPGSGLTFTFTLDKNGSPGAVTCAISGTTATTCSDTTHSVTYAQGDTIDLRATVTGGNWPGASHTVTWTVKDAAS